MVHERTLAPSPFPGDDGLADPAARRALAAAVREPGTTPYLRAVAALCATRVLVPVVATATRTATTTEGLSSDKEADMSVVMLQSADGRRALLGFTGLDALTTWRADARPVPVTIDLAARTARAEGVDTVLVDVSGPFPLAIDGEVLDALAQGHRLVELDEGGFGWAVPVDEAGEPGAAG
ncbi:SseB protein N-terminal domain-containing protein [Microlunatus sagamiharensis]|uniref:SseB protein N-terminal domain-containing protein n=1 Tax=Microlunatus sagamiharensis TaxID=546874 RepID=A0A1H2LVT7_9ACTN|nr:SseB family protein [Microlunatus sagamiharensis]SDU85130.1 SseB protein N-terminal domain-containing protein [Microlunatus sagamiharensis]